MAWLSEQRTRQQTRLKTLVQTCNARIARRLKVVSSRSNRVPTPYIPYSCLWIKCNIYLAHLKGQISKFSMARLCERCQRFQDWRLDPRFCDVTGLATSDPLNVTRDSAHQRNLYSSFLKQFRDRLQCSRYDLSTAPNVQRIDRCISRRISQAMPQSRADAEKEVRSWGFSHVFTWSDGP